MDFGSLPTEYALVNCDVIAGDDLELFRPGYVVVREGVIAAVGKGQPVEDLPQVDLAGRLVLPGLINCHTHLGDAALPELGFGLWGDSLLWPPDGLRHQHMAALSNAELVSGMRRAIRRMLASGTVAFADFREGGLPGVLALREACDGLPIECLAFGRYETFPVQDEATLQENLAGLSPQHIEEITAVLEVADGFTPLWANDATDLALQQTAEVVRGLGKRLATHGGETARYRELSIARTGQSDITRIVRFLDPDFVVHMTSATDAEIDQLVEAEIPIVMCARTQTALGIGLPPWVRAVDRGARVGLGTDNAMISSPDLLAEMDLISRASRGASQDPTLVDARRLLASATIEGARTLGLDDRLGSLAPSKEATFVVVDMSSDNLAGVVNPVAALVERVALMDIEAVVVRGALATGRIAVSR